MTKSKFTNRQTAKNNQKMRKLQVFDEFERKQKTHSREVFFVWMGIMLFSVIAAHFVLNVGPASVTGFATASADPTGNALTGVYALLTLGIIVFAVGVGFFILTRNDK